MGANSPTEGRPSILVIGGPTASGKSALAAEAAGRFGGVVVNADSMQLYRDLPILTSWPGDALRARAPHRLYGVLDGAERCSAGRWRSLAMAEIERIHGDDALPILVGGTGLYLRALLDGLAPVPAIPETVREAVRTLCEREGSVGLHARLAERDPEAAGRLQPGDSQRVMRAYEVIEATGRSLLSWQAERHDRYIGRAAVLVLEPPRDALYAACNERFERMMAAGALEEAARLLARGLNPGLPVMKAVGVRALLDHLSGVTTLERAVELGRQATRRYAKCQTTWFRTQMPGHARMPVRYRAESKRESLALVARLLLTD
ncbi:MAG: tRNA (adenosine(37)-N6)-dimethylallyltransferase MiaA [Rhodospirillaceae bacterium]|nr:tRNA (adenosine(37)-N6)-dimethylallyltransferase MiaA [Rhodospirillaceae bacterium]